MQRGRRSRLPSGSIRTRRVGIASEGSFGPHPSLPFAALDRELVLLIDRETGLELVGHHATIDRTLPIRW
jgi:hypothetical protein